MVRIEKRAGEGEIATCPLTVAELVHGVYQAYAAAICFLTNAKSCLMAVSSPAGL